MRATHPHLDGDGRGGKVVHRASLRVGALGSVEPQRNVGAPLGFGMAVCWYGSDCLSSHARARARLRSLVLVGVGRVRGAAYIGVEFMVYETLKRQWELQTGASAGTLILLLCGAVSGAAGQASAHPLDVVRRRSLVGVRLIIVYQTVFGFGLLNMLVAGAMRNKMSHVNGEYIFGSWPAFFAWSIPSLVARMTSAGAIVQMKASLPPVLT